MEIGDYISKTESFLEKQKDYLNLNDWRRNVPDINEYEFDTLEKDIHRRQFERKKKEANLHTKVVEGVRDRLKYFTQTYKAKAFLPENSHFIELARSVIEIHCDRVDSYTTDYPIFYEGFDSFEDDEAEFQNNLFRSATKLREVISSFNLSEDETRVEFYAENIAPLIMHEFLVEKFPQIKSKTEEKEIDFKSKPKQTLHLNNPNPPVWDPNLHYYDQEKETLQYYVDELKKIKQGVEIDGVYINGWMYFHMNFFVTSVPTNYVNPISGVIENKDVIGVPGLRDNEWFIIMENYELAKKLNKMVFVAAARRIAKTTMNSSHLSYCIVSGKMKILCAGGSSDDLKQMTQNVELCMNNIHPAFRTNLLTSEWEKEVTFGLRMKSAIGITQTTMRIKNLEGGAKSKSEAFAGFTPDAVLIDEIMKIPFKAQLTGLMPAISGEGGTLRCVVMLTGTAGSSELAKDAFNVLKEPSTMKILEMPWDVLDRMAGENITWKRRPFGTFLPGQMAKHPDGASVKYESNLADFLGVESEELSKTKMMVTDWKTSNENHLKVRKDIKRDLITYTREVLYYPMDPSDMLLSTEINPFNVQLAIHHKEYLLSKGRTGRKVTLDQNVDGTISVKDSDKELAVYPHPGGFIDSPIVLYEAPPENEPADYLYVAGFDDYKQDESSTDSVGSFHIYRVDSTFVKNGGKIVASLATRPDPHTELHRQIYLLQVLFNAKCLMENADMTYKIYLDNLRVTDLWLQKSIDFETDVTTDSEGKRKFGWNPSPKNKKLLLGMFVQYTNRDYYITDEETGDVIPIKGMQQIDDLGLLDEIIGYDSTKNVDRITSAMTCIGQEFYYYTQGMFPNISKQLNKHKNKEQDKENKRKSSMFFNKSSRGGFFK